MSTENPSADDRTVEALEQKVRQQRERIDDLERQLERIRAKVRLNTLQMAETEGAD